jgi:hypothetical protein
MKKMGSFGRESGLGEVVGIGIAVETKESYSVQVQSRRDLRWVALSVFVTASLGSGNWHGMEGRIWQGCCKLVELRVKKLFVD